MARKSKPASLPWRNAIVGYGEESVDQLLANDKNARIHPQFQQDALSGVIKDIGVIQTIIINKRTSGDWPLGDRGVETLVDGHLRVRLALREGQPTLPVTYVDLAPAQEAEALATYDPITGLALYDREALDGLLRQINTGEPAVQAMLAELAKHERAVPPEFGDGTASLLAGALSSENERAVNKLSDILKSLIACPECGCEFIP